MKIARTKHHVMQDNAGAMCEFGRQASKEGLGWNKPADEDEISHEVVVRHILCHRRLDLSRLH